MKPTARVIDVQTNMTGEKVGMTIDDSALAHIMSVLTDLYSDPELAVIREYSTNALDAHIQAGITVPIKVTLPSPLSPYFSVQDFGEGLDIDDIRDIYSRYGTSTKRQSNDVVGMLGLGCKSALTYTDQFTLTAIKNGKMIQVSISRDEQGVGSMMILDESDSSAPSGVTVMIPAKMGNRFQEKANDFFQYWEVGTVEVNGVKPKRIDGIWLTDNLLLTKEIDNSIVVMGNVPYPMLADHTASYGGYNQVHTVAFVNIGDVHFTPSRESLQATKETKATLLDIRTTVNREKEKTFLKMIMESPTRYDAFKKFFEVKALGFTGKPIYRGEEIPLDWTPPTHEVTDARGNKFQEYVYSFILVNKVKSLYGRSKSWTEARSLKNNPDTPYAWVTGYKSETFTAYKREKMEQFFSHHNLPTTVTQIVFVPSLPDKVADWTPKNLIFKWEDIEKEKIVRENVKRNDGRPTGSYKGWIDGKREDSILAGNIDASKPIFWLHTNNNTYYKPNEFTFAMEKNPDATCIVLGGNRIAKFKRDFPNAENARDYCKALAVDWGKNLTDGERLALYLAINSRETNNFAGLDPAKVNDPALKQTIITYLADSKRGEALEAEYNSLIKYGATLGKVDWKNPTAKYPLLTNIYNYGSLTPSLKEHLYIYINAVYAELSAEKEGA